jgi:hypothetical protein
MGVRKKKKRKEKELDWAHAQLIKTNSFWAFRNVWAQDLLGPISGNARPKPNLLFTLIKAQLQKPNPIWAPKNPKPN